MKELERLAEYLNKLAPEGLCVAFSGGVDSAVVLKAACALTKNVRALTMYTPFHSPLEPEDAKQQAEAYGAVHGVLELAEMPSSVMGNPRDRCYLCKKEIFTQIKGYAEQNRLRWVLDGTNADDLEQYRPGLRALKELEIKSPLAELGIRKAQVRRMAAELGLKVADKPSAPCLATRFPYDTPIDLETLRRVDGLEQAIRGLGAKTVRVRVHGDLLRIEAPADQLALLVERREMIITRCHEAGFPYVTLDLEGFRSGSMDRLSFCKKRKAAKKNG